MIKSYKDDEESVYNTWFIDPERIKYFGAIRRGVQKVVSDIKEKKFPNDLKDSSLEVVVEAISEQKQIFAGSAHPWFWKPKLRIPDIYEDQNNKREFGECLETCLKTSNEKNLLDALNDLSSQNIKGLGPALSNILYFLHPTLFPAFNTSIVNGFNIVTGFNVKLGDWNQYFFLREKILAINDFWKGELSKDIGVIVGLFFEIGIGRQKVPTEMLAGRNLKLSKEIISRIVKKRRE